MPPGAIISMPICVPPLRTWRIQRTTAMLHAWPGRSCRPIQFARLQLGGHLLRPAQAIAAGAVVDDGQGVGRVVLGGVSLCVGLRVPGLHTAGRLVRAVLDFLQRHAGLPVGDLLCIEGAGPGVLDVGFEARRLGRFLDLQDLVERAAPGEEVVQGAHADAQGQLALAPGCAGRYVSAMSPQAEERCCSRSRVTLRSAAGVLSRVRPQAAAGIRGSARPAAGCRCPGHWPVGSPGTANGSAAGRRSAARR